MKDKILKEVHRSMKSKQEFFDEFFARLQKEGLTVNILSQSDVAAEISDSESQPICAVTHDGDIVYENYNADTARILNGCAAKARQKTGACTEVPFKDLESMDTVVLPKGSYYRIFESSTVILLCRHSDLFGYEFITCKKANPRINKRMLYHGMVFYDLHDAQDSFLQRSGLVDERPVFCNAELMLILSCCIERMKLDNEMPPDMEKEISALISKIEGYLPENIDLSPRLYFENERS